MSWPRNKNINQMHQMYLDGSSLAKVAKAFGFTRQSVWELFTYNKLPLRPKPEPLPHVEFMGNKYTLRNNGYLGMTNAKRTLLHRDVWESENGPIPLGYDIHHRDENKLNCDLANLECLPKSEHTKKYSPHNNQYTRGRKK